MFPLNFVESEELETYDLQSDSLVIRIIYFPKTKINIFNIIWLSYHFLHIRAMQHVKIWARERHVFLL